MFHRLILSDIEKKTNPLFSIRDYLLESFIRGVPLSKKELKEKKLDTRWLWGVGAGIFSIGAAAFLLLAHKNKHRDEDRAMGIDDRTSLRCKLLSDKITSLHLRIEHSTDESERKALVQLLREAKLLRTQLINESSLPLQVRIVIEKLNEAEAALENSLFPFEDSE